MLNLKGKKKTRKKKKKALAEENLEEKTLIGRVFIGKAISPGQNNSVSQF